MGDTGSFRFNFGYYFASPALDAIDLSTDAGKIAYATQALAPGNAVLIFDDVVHNPGATQSAVINGGTVLGFFLIPDASLSSFQANPGSYAINGVGSGTFVIPPPLRWPLFGLADANPGQRDQLMSFFGISSITGNLSNLFAWEDLTRTSIANNPQPSDSQFNDLIFAIQGVAPSVAPSQVPEPWSVTIWGVIAAGVIGCWRRGRAHAPASM